MNIVFWCEFPSQIDWNKAEKLLDFPCEIYIAVQSLKELITLKKKTSLKLNPWPLLSREKGYWFSGYTGKEDIDKLKEFKGYKLKIDLEPPLPKWKYSTWRWFYYAFRILFTRPKNTEYLSEVIYELSESSPVEEVVGSSSLLLNEFPAAKWYLEKTGLTIHLKKNISKNIMAYSYFAGPVLRPFVRFYLSFFIRRRLKENSDIMFSVGLVGTGILEKEGTYRNSSQLKEDIEMVKNAGGKKVAVYSLEGIMKRNNPQEWIDVIKIQVLK